MYLDDRKFTRTYSSLVTLRDAMHEMQSPPLLSPALPLGQILASCSQLQAFGAPKEGGPGPV